MNRKLAFAGIVLSLVALITGCSSKETEQTSWSAPQWMAEQKQMEEQFVLNLQSCMDSKGWSLTVDSAGGFLEPFSSTDEMERAKVDGDACLNEQGIDPSFLSEPLTDASLRKMYTYDVDTYDCLVAQGIKMQNKPPSEDVYVEQALAAQSGIETPDSWWPYGDEVFTSLNESQVKELKESCPERWTFMDLR